MWWHLGVDAAVFLTWDTALLGLVRDVVLAAVFLTWDIALLGKLG